MINFNDYTITEQRVGWGHTWNVTPNELKHALKGYNFTLYEGMSECIHTVTHLKTFIGLKELVKRRIEEFEDDFSDDEYFNSFDDDYFTDAIQNISNARSIDEMQTTLYELERDTALCLYPEYPESEYVYFNNIINLDIWNDETNGIKYIFQLERMTKNETI